MDSKATPIATNLRAALSRIASAAQTANRNPEDVKLVAVSKTQPEDAIKQALAAGQIRFGENKVQEMMPKADAFPNAEWHLVGHLQSNKVKYIVGFVSLIHSVDSLKLLQEIGKQASKAQRLVACLLQINISEEVQKSGATPDTAESILQAAPMHKHVRIAGLMGIAEETQNTQRIQAQFASLRHMREMWAPKYAAWNVELTELSMGMSNDYALAIAEGATLVRIGSGVFGTRPLHAKPTREPGA